MKRICVYCGSSLGKNPEFVKSAKLLAEELVKRNIGLVYGGANVGIMGEIADTVLAGGGEVIGVIPQALIEKEVSHTGLSELKVVNSMHERKAIMAELSDGFIALPGGLGTLEEIFEVLTWSQLGFHKKPCALLNVKRYYDDLTSFLNHAVDEEFVKSSHKEMMLVDSDPVKLIDGMMNYIHPTIDKWVGRKDL